MEYRIEFLADPDRVEATTSGAADRETFARLFAELTSHPRLAQGMPIVFDHSGLEVGSLPSAEVEAIGRSAVPLSRSVGGSPIAVIVPDALAFGLARMAGAYASSDDLRLAFFYDRTEALEWIRAERPA